MEAAMQDRPAGESQIPSGQRKSVVYDRCKIVSSKKDIRLLTLRPGNVNDVLCCTLHVANLESSPVYSALSYTWGQGNDHFWVKVNGERFSVTKNLFQALLQIRAHTPAKPQVLWIDAICIDQSSLEERSQQVGLMGEVYSKCDRVIVWLGTFGEPPERKCCALVGDDSDFDQKWDDYLSCFEFEDEQKPSLETATYYASTNSTTIDTTQQLAWFFRLVADGYDYASHPLLRFRISQAYSDRKDRDTINSVIGTSLVMNEWITRLWVVQEAVLAPSLTILFGSASLPYDVLVKARDAVEKHPHPNASAEFQINGHMWFLRSFSSIQSLRDSRAEGEGISLLPLRIRLNQTTASEDLDQIYGLLGLAQEDERIVPDYSASVQQVYTDFCGQYICQRSSLLPLAFAAVRSRYPDLPSWVIDWTVVEKVRPGYRSSWLSIIPLFNACGGLIQSGSVWSENTLSVSGIEFDRIRDTSKTMEYYKRESLTNWVDFCIRSGNSQEYPSGCSFRSAFWRTICLDSNWTPTSTRRASNEDICYLIQAVHSERKLEPQFPVVESDLVDTSGSSSHHQKVYMLTTVAVFIHSHKLFITDKGYIGMANCDAQVGDQVFVLPGLEIPIILRPAGVGRHQTAGLCDSYTVVSESYVHGIMDGEVVRGSEWSMKDLVIQ